jgi:hypothetical protein
MNEFLAQYFGTNGATETVESTESAEKTAQVELFAKLAEENGIDLDQLTDEQVSDLWQATFAEKTASDDSDEDDKKGDKEEGDKKAPPFAKKDDGDEKKAAAEAEFSEKKAAAEKFAEAEFLGRAMAHAYVNELEKIAAAARTETEEVKEAAGTKSMAMLAALEKGRGAAKSVGDAAKKVNEKTKEPFQRLARIGEGGKTVPRGVNKVRDAVADHGNKAVAGAAAAGGVAAASKKKKEASALNELARESALAKIAESGEFDGEIAADRIDAVLTLTGGDLQGTKVASAENVDQAVEIRSLELLEAAGYPVNWA